MVNDPSFRTQAFQAEIQGRTEAALDRGAENLARGIGAVGIGLGQGMRLHQALQLKPAQIARRTPMMKNFPAMNRMMAV